MLSSRPLSLAYPIKMCAIRISFCDRLNASSTNLFSVSVSFSYIGNICVRRLFISAISWGGFHNFLSMVILFFNLKQLCDLNIVLKVDYFFALYFFLNMAGKIPLH